MGLNWGGLSLGYKKGNFELKSAKELPYPQILLVIPDILIPCLPYCVFSLTTPLPLHGPRVNAYAQCDILHLLHHATPKFRRRPHLKPPIDREVKRCSTREKMTHSKEVDEHMYTQELFMGTSSWPNFLQMQRKLWCPIHKFRR